MECKNSEIKEPTQTLTYNNLYKYNGLLNTNQCDRRNKLLAELKKRRNDQIDELRGIVEIFHDSDTGEPVNVVEYNKKRYKKYGKKIMLSEWMTEVPKDLEDVWIFKICPVGVRNIIVAQKGLTKAYNRKNKVMAVFQSNLPGGNRVENFHKFTLLDCIYRDKEKTYYVLDVLVWNSFSLLQCSTEFRFFFIQSKLLEDPQLISPLCNFKFVNIQYYPALLPTIEALFMNLYVVNDVELPVDGILFYHKNCTYMSGLTPLVGWLKPYMISEKLHIPVNESYVMNKPENYINLELYLEQLEKTYRKGKKIEDENETESSEMDAEVLEEDNEMD